MTSSIPADSPRHDEEEDNTNRNFDEIVHDKRPPTARGKRPYVPRKDFHLLTFPEEIDHPDRTVWKNRFLQQLCNNVTMPRCNEWYFKNIYVSRKSPSIIADLKNGVYGGIRFISKDKPPNEKPPRYREFIIRGYPNIWEIGKLHDILGSLSDNVHSLCRFQFQGKPMDSVKLVWKSNTEDPPKQLPLYADIEDSPLLSFQQMEPRQPRCYFCQELGHIQYNCKSKDDGNSQHERRVRETTGRKEATVNKLSCLCGADNVWNCSCRKRPLLHGNDTPGNSIPTSEIPVAALHREIIELKKKE